MASFYIGKYLILQEELAPKHDADSWAFPDAPTQHMGETSNVEELLVDPEDMNVLPTQIQFGFAEWTDDEGFSPDHLAFDEFYTAVGVGFYTRGFTKGTELYNEFYTPIGVGFYTRSFTAGTALYTEFYTRQESFYLRSFTAGTELYNTFYVADQAFYLRSFTPIDFFYSIPEDC